MLEADDCVVSPAAWEALRPHVADRPVLPSDDGDLSRLRDRNRVDHVPQSTSVASRSRHDTSRRPVDVSTRDEGADIKGGTGETVVRPARLSMSPGVPVRRAADAWPTRRAA